MVLDWLLDLMTSKVFFNFFCDSMICCGHTIREAGHWDIFRCCDKCLGKRRLHLWVYNINMASSFLYCRQVSNSLLLQNSFCERLHCITQSKEGFWIPCIITYLHCWNCSRITWTVGLPGSPRNQWLCQYQSSESDLNVFIYYVFNEKPMIKARDSVLPS